MKQTMGLVLCMALLLGLAAGCGGAEPIPSAAQLLELGEQYLLDLEYEQALAQFLKVIEIEPNATRAYLGAAEACLGLGDTESAVAILERGLAETGSAEIQGMLDALRTGLADGPDAALNLTGQPPFSRADLEQWIYPPGLSVWDVQEVFGLDAEDILSAAEGTGEARAEGEGNIHGAIPPMDDSTTIWIGENGELAGIDFEAGNSFGLQPIRGIPFGASMSDVLETFAVHNHEAVAFVQELDIPAYLNEDRWIEIYGLEQAQAYFTIYDTGEAQYLALFYEVGDGVRDVFGDEVLFVFTDEGVLFRVEMQYNYYA